MFPIFYLRCLLTTPTQNTILIQSESDWATTTNKSLAPSMKVESRESFSRTQRCIAGSGTDLKIANLQ